MEENPHNNETILKAQNLEMSFFTKNKKALKNQDIDSKSLAKTHQAHTQILNAINFDIKTHEFISVVGDSGCGKSTLLKILAGYLAPTGGQVMFKNNIHNKPDANIAVMFQHSTLYPWLNLAQNVAFSSKMRGYSKQEQEKIANEYLQLVGLKQYATHYPYQCSGGMNARATLAQVLACRSGVILMDEPFSALDVFTKRSMQELIRFIFLWLKSSIFFITHDIEEALYLSDRIFIMKSLSRNVKSNITEILPIPLDKQNREALERSKAFIELKEYLYARIKERYDYVI